MSSIAITPREFFQALFHDTEYNVNLRAVHRGIHTVSEFVRPEEILQFGERFWDRNVYFGCATRNGGGGKEHIREIPVLWTDIDFKDTPAEEANRLIKDFPLPPSFVVVTGGGYHVYWLLKESAGREDIPQVEAALRGLARSLKGDPASTDASRILRVPGTFNVKPEYGKPRAVFILRAYPDRQYNLSDFDLLSVAPELSPQKVKSSLGVSSLVDRCSFLQRWERDAAYLPEPEWYAGISILGRLPGGFDYIHFVSAKYSGYTRKETEAKIRHAINDAGPRTCAELKKLWNCEMDCGVKSPAVLASREPRGNTPIQNAAGATQPLGPEKGISLYVRNACDIEARPVTWLWKERLPLGKLVVGAGEPGTAKSRASLSIAATVSKGGGWPGNEGRCEPGEVLIANFEDDPADTSIPRLQAEGADLSRIRFLEGVQGDKGRRPFDLGQDIERLRKHLEAYPGTRLLIVDPISACMGGADSHKNAEVRAILHPLADVAHRHSVCVLAITHMNKGNGRALHRVIGSIAFAAAARVAFAFAKDPDDPEGLRHLFLPIKNNLGNDRTGLSFSTELVSLPSGICAPRIVWGTDAVTIGVDDALELPGEERGARQEAMEFLLTLLADGPVSAQQVDREARNAGIARNTLFRAKRSLKIVSGKTGFNRGWEWRLLSVPPAPESEEY